MGRCIVLAFLLFLPRVLADRSHIPGCYTGASDRTQGDASTVRLKFVAEKSLRGFHQEKFSHCRHSGWFDHFLHGQDVQQTNDLRPSFGADGSLLTVVQRMIWSMAMWTRMQSRPRHRTSQRTIHPLRPLRQSRREHACERSGRTRRSWVDTITGILFHHPRRCGLAWI